jgi:hypothetical protein
MRQLTLGLSTLVILFAAASPVRADYSIVRWSYGDCKIWYDAPGSASVPEGAAWAIVAGNLPYYEAAKAVLEDLYRQGVCH